MSTNTIVYLRCMYASAYVIEEKVQKYRVKFIDSNNAVYLCTITDTTIFRPNRYYKVSYTGMKMLLDKCKREYVTLTGIQILSCIDYDTFRASRASTEEANNYVKNK